jgi:DNA-binding IscR family transcriptional regulator
VGLIRRTQEEIGIEMMIELLEQIREFDITAIVEQQAITNQLLAQILVKLNDERT